MVIVRITDINHSTDLGTSKQRSVYPIEPALVDLGQVIDHPIIGASARPNCVFELLQSPNLGFKSSQGLDVGVGPRTSLMSCEMSVQSGNYWRKKRYLSYGGSAGLRRI